MTPEEFNEIVRVLNLVPPLPWHFSDGDDLDHWELWSSDKHRGFHMVQDDSDVPPDPGFIEYVLNSRRIIESLLREFKNSGDYKWLYHEQKDISSGYREIIEDLKKEIRELRKQDTQKHG